MSKKSLRAFSTLFLCRKSCLHVITPQSNAGRWQVCCLLVITKQQIIHTCSLCVQDSYHTVNLREYNFFCHVYSFTSQLLILLTNIIIVHSFVVVEQTYSVDLNKNNLLCL